MVRGTVVLVEVGKLPIEKTPKPKKLYGFGAAGRARRISSSSGGPTVAASTSRTHHTLHETNPLGWSTPRVRHQEQAERWSWLVLAAYAQS